MTKINISFCALLVKILTAYCTPHVRRRRFHRSIVKKETMVNCLDHSLALTTLKDFSINHGDQRVFLNLQSS